HKHSHTEKHTICVKDRLMTRQMLHTTTFRATHHTFKPRAHTHTHTHTHTYTHTQNVHTHVPTLACIILSSPLNHRNQAFCLRGYYTLSLSLSLSLCAEET